MRVDLVDVAGTPITDPKVVIRFHRMPDRRIVKTFESLAYPLPPGHLFTVPAFPEVRGLFAYILASLFRPRHTPFFLPTTATPVSQTVRLVRRRDAWTARFTPWHDLPDAYASFRAALENSPGLRVLGGPSFDLFTGVTYDTASAAVVHHAKASLLNLHRKLTDLSPRPRTSWFSYIERILVIGRERLIALVKPAIAGEIRRIKGEIGRHPYHHSPADHHHKNFPARYQVRKSQMISIKSKETLGNVQLTVGPGNDPATGTDVILLDADIDEHGELLAHFADLITHAVTGGTHPFDIHEFLLLSNPNADLGYRLIPA